MLFKRRVMAKHNFCEAGHGAHCRTVGDQLKTLCQGALLKLTQCISSPLLCMLIFRRQASLAGPAPLIALSDGRLMYLLLVFTLWVTQLFDFNFEKWVHVLYSLVWSSFPTAVAELHLFIEVKELVFFSACLFSTSTIKIHSPLNEEEKANHLWQEWVTTDCTSPPLPCN